MDKLTSIKKINFHNIEKPQFVFRPTTLKKTVNYFINNFQGKILYAVKTNPEKMVVEEIVKNGIKAFDVASLSEIELIKDVAPEAELFFMNPVKPRHSIKKAFSEFGVSHFSFDNDSELKKIRDETNNSKNIGLHLRLAIPNNYAEHQLSGKFGADLQHAPKLLKMASEVSDDLGICFHVGSQCMHPDAYLIAMRMATEVVKKSGVSVSYFNVGGGFPSVYPGMIPPDLNEYFDAIHSEFDQIKETHNATLMCEPGRALAAESMSLVVRVDLRKENSLYINDGTYGSLFDAGTPGLIYPVRLIEDESVSLSELVPFKFFGPTCDSLDIMEGPFYLPSHISEGDYIEIGQMGAYGRTLSSSFNGFDIETHVISIDDEPLMTMYDENKISSTPLEVIGA